MAKLVTAFNEGQEVNTKRILRGKRLGQLPFTAQRLWLYTTKIHRLLLPAKKTPKHNRVLVFLHSTLSSPAHFNPDKFTDPDVNIK